MLMNLRRLLIENPVPKLKLRNLDEQIEIIKDRLRFGASHDMAFDADVSIMKFIHNILVFWLELAQEFLAGCGESKDMVKLKYGDDIAAMAQHETFQRVWELVLDIEEYIDNDEMSDEEDYKFRKDIFERLAEILPSLWV